MWDNHNSSDDNVEVMILNLYYLFVVLVQIDNINSIS